MTLKFDGTITQLEQILSENGIKGSWHTQPNGVFMFRLRDGANLHWAEGSKGNELSAKRLIAKGWTIPDNDSTAEYARARWSIPA